MVLTGALGGSAARLSARRRDDRLASLRLLGATPRLVRTLTVVESTVLAAVGAIQFEVAKYRLESEYNVKTIFTSLPYSVARRVTGEQSKISVAQLPPKAKLVEDWDGNPVALFESDWSLRLAEEWNPALKFVEFTAVDAQLEVA